VRSLHKSFGVAAHQSGSHLFIFPPFLFDRRGEEKKGGRWWHGGRTRGAI